MLAQLVDCSDVKGALVHSLGQMLRNFYRDRFIRVFLVWREWRILPDSS